MLPIRWTIDRFMLIAFTVASAPPGARVLLLDDTWTTGARVQSLSHALKSAGAKSVVAVVLGRHVNAAHEGSKALVDRAGKGTFGIRRCVLDS
jgi:orotate phosphoribosyltransferase